MNDKSPVSGEARLRGGDMFKDLRSLLVTSGDDRDVVWWMGKVSQLDPTRTLRRPAGRANSQGASPPDQVRAYGWQVMRAVGVLIRRAVGEQARGG